MSTTDRTILNEIQYQVVEPPNLGASYPSGLWTVAEISGYLTQRQNRILYETGCVVTRAEPIVTMQNILRYNYPPTWLQTRRMMWEDANGVSHPLLRSAIWALDYGLVSWEDVMSPAPLVFMDDITPTLQFQISPAGEDTGVLNVFFIQQGSVLSNTGVAVTIPDDLVWILKWGVLADMFGHAGRAQDPQRASYAESRFAMGIELVTNLIFGGTTEANG
jgi:hypothetical protein